VGQVVAGDPAKTVNIDFVNQAAGVTYGKLRNGVYKLP
jgi:hypothetical protein